MTIFDRVRIFPTYERTMLELEEHAIMISNLLSKQLNKHKKMPKQLMNKVRPYNIHLDFGTYDDIELKKCDL